jgi:hypothetical protein
LINSEGAEVPIETSALFFIMFGEIFKKKYDLGIKSWLHVLDSWLTCIAPPPDFAGKPYWVI